VSISARPLPRWPGLIQCWRQRPRAEPSGAAMGFHRCARCSQPGRQEQRWIRRVHGLQASASPGKGPSGTAALASPGRLSFHRFASKAAIRPDSKRCLPSTVGAAEHRLTANKGLTGKSPRRAKGSNRQEESQQTQGVACSILSRTGAEKPPQPRQGRRSLDWADRRNERSCSLIDHHRPWAPRGSSSAARPKQAKGQGITSGLLCGCPGVGRVCWRPLKFPDAAGPIPAPLDP